MQIIYGRVLLSSPFHEHSGLCDLGDKHGYVFQGGFLIRKYLNEQTIRYFALYSQQRAVFPRSGTGYANG